MYAYLCFKKFLTFQWNVFEKKFTWKFDFWLSVLETLAKWDDCGEEEEKNMRVDIDEMGWVGY